MTVWRGLIDHWQLKHGQTELIYAGSEGVGQFTVQCAKVRGAAVFATDSADNVEFVTSPGADLVIDYLSQAFVRPTERNRLVENHYAKLGFTKCACLTEGSTQWGLDLATYQTIALPLRIVRSAA